MLGRLYRAAAWCGTVLRDVGSALRGTMPPLRSADGTFGTQRMQAKARANQRRENYPS